VSNWRRTKNERRNGVDLFCDARSAESRRRASAAILSKRLRNDGFGFAGLDLKFRECSETNADDFVVGDLRDQGFCRLFRLIEMKTRAPSNLFVQGNAKNKVQTNFVSPQKRAAIGGQSQSG
jgi:hypothetical protein